MKSPLFSNNPCFSPPCPQRPHFLQTVTFSNPVVLVGSPDLTWAFSSLNFPHCFGFSTLGCPEEDKQPMAVAHDISAWSQTKPWVRWFSLAVGENLHPGGFVSTCPCHSAHPVFSKGGGGYHWSLFPISRKAHGMLLRRLFHLTEGKHRRAVECLSSCYMQDQWTGLV